MKSTNQLALFEPEPKPFDHKSRGTILYRRLSINEKINAKSWAKTGMYMNSIFHQVEITLCLDGKYIFGPWFNTYYPYHYTKSVHDGSHNHVRTIY